MESFCSSNLIVNGFSTQTIKELIGELHWRTPYKDKLREEWLMVDGEGNGCGV